MIMPDISIIFFITLIVIFSLIIGFFILVLMGNLSAMKLLAKNGLAVFSHNIIKDSKLLNYVNREGACWLSVPDICYSPVMYNCDGKYKNHNFLQKENRFGELYLSDSRKVEKLKEISLSCKFVVKDLMTIKGVALGNGTDLRHANFSYLRKISQSIKENVDLDIQLCENGVIRHFKPVSMIDMGLSDKHIFKYDTRDNFLQSLLDFSKIKIITRAPKENVVFLECQTDIDIVLVMLIEKEFKDEKE